MRTFFYTLSILFFTALAFETSAQTVNIPDANFKAYLVGNSSINTNGDTEIQVSEAAAYNGIIQCNALSIADLTGIEAFTALRTLRCYSNSLTSLDVSNNTALVVLVCQNNPIETLDVSNNLNLVELDCASLSLTSLDVSNNIALERLSCGSNSLETIDVSNNVLLEELYVAWNSLGNLDVSNNTALIELRCGGNSLSNLDISNNLALTQLWCSRNELTFLEFSNHITLTEISCAFNLLTVLNLSSVTALEELNCSTNSLTSLNIANGNNANFSSFLAANNPDLSCIQVDDVAFAYTNFTNVDPNTNFSLDCGGTPGIVFIPDVNFKNYLLENTAINTNGDDEIQVSEAALFNQAMNCNGRSIQDLTGIEAFFALTNLNCNDNSIDTLDISYNLHLSDLDCSNNALIALNIANENNTEFNNFNALNNPDLSCIQVDDVDYATTNFTQIDATASFNLYCGAPLPVVYIPDANFKTYLVENSTINTNGDTEIQVTEATSFNGIISCYNLSITDLTGIEAFTEITNLRCYSNSITVLDISNNTALTELSCHGNPIETLDVSNNTALTKLGCYNMSLTALDVSNNIALIELSCGSNALGTLDVSNNVLLEELYVAFSSLSNLDVSNNTALIELRCGGNSLNNLDISNNLALTLLWCSRNELATLDVSNHTALRDLSCAFNLLTDLNVSNNAVLNELNCSDNTLATLNIANGNNANFSSFVATNNPNLSCIQVDDVDYAIANFTTVDASVGFSLNCIPTNNEDLNHAINITVYPNPTKAIIHIETKVDLNTIQVFNMTGQKVMEQRQGLNRIDISRLSTGLYMLHIFTSEGSIIKKIIKQ